MDVGIGEFWLLWLSQGLSVDGSSASFSANCTHLSVVGRYVPLESGKTLYIK